MPSGTAQTGCTLQGVGLVSGQTLNSASGPDSKVNRAIRTVSSDGGIGLVAAIPAVLAYNKLSTDLSRFASRLEGFGTEFGAILSRQSEEKA